MAEKTIGVRCLKVEGTAVCRPNQSCLGQFVGWLDGADRGMVGNVDCKFAPRCNKYPLSPVIQPENIQVLDYGAPSNRDWNVE